MTPPNAPNSLTYNLSLTTFMDFHLNAGTKRVTKARSIYDQYGVPYNRATDYYARVREGIVEMHKNDLPTDILKAILHRAAGTNKFENYKATIGGYGKFISRHVIDWFTPPRAEWMHDRVSIRINPELGLYLDGKKFIIKGYWKKETPTREQTVLMSHLMKNTLHCQDANYAVLDVRTGKLHRYMKDRPELTALAEGEAQCLSALLNNFGSKT